MRAKDAAALVPCTQMHMHPRKRVLLQSEGMARIQPRDPRAQRKTTLWIPVPFSSVLKPISFLSLEMQKGWLIINR